MELSNQPLLTETKWSEMNISGAFCELRGDKDIFDATLACDDDQIQAHVILSVCSPFFLMSDRLYCELQTVFCAQCF